MSPPTTSGKLAALQAVGMAPTSLTPVMVVVVVVVAPLAVAGDPGVAVAATAVVDYLSAIGTDSNFQLKYKGFVSYGLWSSIGFDCPHSNLQPLERFMQLLTAKDYLWRLQA